jgi:5-methylcytosine-specific restriction endonuclease McrA
MPDSATDRKDYLRAWRASHRDQLREYHREYGVRRYWASPDRLRAEARERMRARRAAGLANDDAARVAARDANRTARAYGIPGRLTTEDVRALWERQPICIDCGSGRGIDHIVEMSRGGPNVPANLQTLCQPCNVRKFHRNRRLDRAVAS